MGHVPTAFVWSGHLVERIVMRYDRAIEHARESWLARELAVHTHTTAFPLFCCRFSTTFIQLYEEDHFDVASHWFCTIFLCLVFFLVFVST